MDYSLAIIKPDAVKRHLAGTLLQRIEAARFKLVAAQLLTLLPSQAEAFYAVHREKKFFNEIIEKMVCGPCLVLGLNAVEAVNRFRALIGATDPALAAPGTLRSDFGLSIGENSLHGSDSVENANWELNFFFPTLSLMA